MKTLTYHQDVRASPLLAELLAAGVPALAVRPPLTAGDPVAIDLADGAVDAQVDAVVAAHDPAAIDQGRQDAQHTYDDAIAYLQQFRQQPSGTATNVQRDNAIKALIDVSKKLNADLREGGAATP